MISKLSIVQYILIYLIITMQGSVIFLQYSNEILIAGLVVSIILMLLYKIYFSRCAVLNFIVLSILLLGICFKTSFSLSINSILNILIRLMLVYVCVNLDKNEFLNRFLNVVFLLSLISIICFFIFKTPLESSIIRFMRINYVHTWTGDVSYGGYLYNYIPNYDRNVGIYREPGMYQILLNVALYILFFKVNNFSINKRLLYSVVIITTIISAQSTTGYISLISLIVFFLFSKDGFYKKKMLSIVFIAALALSIVIIPKSNNFINQNFFEKIKFNTKSMSFKNGSSNSRLVMMKIDLSILSEKEFGTGFEEYQNYWDVKKRGVIDKETSSAVGITKNLAVFGIATGMYMILLMIIGFFYKSRNIIEFLAILFIYINTCLSQPEIFFPLFIVLMMINKNDIRKDTIDDKGCYYINLPQQNL